MPYFKSLKLFVLMSLFGGVSIAQDVSFTMEMTSAKLPSGGMTMKVVSSGKKVAMQPIGGPMASMRIIVDGAASKQYVLMENNGQKTAMMVNPPAEKSTDTKEAEPKVTRTKETKIIDGQKCVRYTVESDKSKSDMWVSPQAVISYQDLYRIFNSTKGTPGNLSVFPASASIQGFPLEITSTEKESKTAYTVRIKSISKAKADPSVFSMEGYKMVDMTKKGQ